MRVRTCPARKCQLIVAKEDGLKDLMCYSTAHSNSARSTIEPMLKIVSRVIV